MVADSLMPTANHLFGCSQFWVFGFRCSLVPTLVTTYPYRGAGGRFLMQPTHRFSGDCFARTMIPRRGFFWDGVNWTDLAVDCWLFPVETLGAG